MGADVLVESFVEDYPTSNKNKSRYIEVAHYYFDQGNYPKSLEWFDKADSNNMSQAERENIISKGYAYFTAKNTKEATKYFNQVVNSRLLEVRRNTI